MATKIVRNTSISLPLLALFTSVMLPPLDAEAAIYRCGPAGSQWYSQIPCEENSEQVIVEDHVMFKETGDTADSAQGKEDDARQADAISKAQAFIAQLEKQRNEQLAEIDRNIEELQSKSGNGDEADESSADAQVAASLLTSMQSNRQSIQSEYEAMISAARQRIENP